jgi:hypothetical protein
MIDSQVVTTIFFLGKTAPIFTKIPEKIFSATTLSNRNARISEGSKRKPYDRVSIEHPDSAGMSFDPYGGKITASRYGSNNPRHSHTRRGKGIAQSRAVGIHEDIRKGFVATIQLCRMNE